MGVRITLTLRKSDYIANESLFEDKSSIEPCGDNMVSLDFEDISHAELEFERELVERRIPYDKSWESGCDQPSGTEYCRVLSDGDVSVKSFLGQSQATLNMNETIQAYKQGNIVAFLTEQLNACTPMSWDDQEVIMAARFATKVALSALDDEMLTDLLVDVSCDTTNALASNKQTTAEKIDHLLNHGYLANKTSRHIPKPLTLFNHTDDFWSVNEIQFPRLIAEISANFSLNGEEWVDMKESMNVDDDDLNELFNRADDVWENAKLFLPQL